jgi:hypothetical protein
MEAPQARQTLATRDTQSEKRATLQTHRQSHDTPEHVLPVTPGEDQKPQSSNAGLEPVLPVRKCNGYGKQADVLGK